MKGGDPALAPKGLVMDAAVEFEISDELGRSVYRRLFALLELWVFGLIGVLTCGLVVGISLRAQKPLSPEIAVPLVPAFVLFYWLNYRSKKRKWLAPLAEMPHRRFAIRICDEELVWESPVVTIRLTWQQIVKTRQFRGLLLAYYGQGRYIWIPTELLDEDARSWLLRRITEPTDSASCSSPAAQPPEVEAGSPAAGRDESPAQIEVSYEMTDPLARQVFRHAELHWEWSWKTASSLLFMVLFTVGMVIARRYVLLACIWAAIALLVAWGHLRRKRAWEALTRSLGHRRFTFRISDRGVLVSMDLGDHMIPWGKVRMLEKQTAGWFLFLANNQCYMLPSDCLDDSTRDLLAERVRDAGGKVR